MNKENKIWLSKDDDINVITQSKMIVTDVKMYNEMVSELKNIDTYIAAGCSRVDGFSRNFTMYTSTGAVQYEDLGEWLDYHYEYYYKNPRLEVLQLMSYDSKSDIDLLDLFATLECGNSKEKQIEEFNRARTIISQLEGSSLNIDTLNQIIKQMWPNFGFYAIEVLKCIDIEIGQCYNIDELNVIVESSQKLGLEVSNDVKRILANRELAKSNGKILSLARKAHKMVNLSK